MDQSRFLAGLIGPIMIAVAVSQLLNPDLIQGLAGDIAASPALILVTGVLAMLAGLAIVRSHNAWRGWPAVVTVFGWLALVGGAIRILFPAFVAEITAAVGESQGVAPIVGGVVLLLGLFLAYQGWFARPAPPSSPA